MHTEVEPVPDTETGHMQQPADEGLRGTATQFAEIIEETESNARDYIANVRRQSEAIVGQAEADARRRQAEMISETQRGLADLASTTESLLQDADELRNSLEAATMSIGQASVRLRQQVDDLLAAGADGDIDYEPDSEDGSDPSYPPPERRRFGLR